MAIKINENGTLVQIGTENTGFEISGMELLNNRTSVPKGTANSMQINIPTWANYVLFTCLLPGLDAADTTTYKPQYLGCPVQLISLSHMDESQIYTNSNFYVRILTEAQANLNPSNNS